MARRSRSSASSSVRTSAPSRSASTAAAPSRTGGFFGGSSAPSRPAQAPPAQPAAAAPKQPGLFAQMASTAAGVAIGSSIGHTVGAAITGSFRGNESQAPADYQQQQQQPQEAYYSQQQSSAVNPASACEPDTKAFLRCLESNNNDISSCQFYYDMLKQCQAASANSM